MHQVLYSYVLDQFDKFQCGKFQIGRKIIWNSLVDKIVQCTQYIGY